MIGRYARGLAARGHDVRLVSVGEPHSTMFYGELPTTVLGIEGFPRSKADYVRAGWAAIRRVSEYSGVIIPTWTPTLPLAVFLKAMRKGGKTVWLAQDYREMFAGLPTETWLLESGARFCDAVITISTLCAEHLNADRHPDKVTIVHSGLDEVFFRDDRTAATEGDEGPATLLFVGDPIGRKGWAEFLEAWRRLREERPGLGFVLVCRTPPEEGLPEGGTVRVGLSDEEVADEYRRASVYVCASHAEGWGLPALEAMAVGTPVVTTLHGGCEAYVQEGVNCLTAPVGDAVALQAAVARILADAELRKRLIRGGRKTAERYTWERAIDRFEAVCQG